MNLKMFHCTASAFQDENLIDMPGFSHRSQPKKRKSYSYPFEEYFTDVWIYAKNRSHAVKQLRIVANVRDLDSGSRAKEVPAFIQNSIHCKP